MGQPDVQEPATPKAEVKMPAKAEVKTSAEQLCTLTGETYPSGEEKTTAVKFSVECSEDAHVKKGELFFGPKFEVPHNVVSLEEDQEVTTLKDFFKTPKAPINDFVSW